MRAPTALWPTSDPAPRAIPVIIIPPIPDIMPPPAWGAAWGAALGAGAGLAGAAADLLLLLPNIPELPDERPPDDLPPPLGILSISKN